MYLLLFVLAAIAIIILLIAISTSNRAKSWTGVVTDIRERTVWKDGIKGEEAIVSYRTESGGTGTLRLPLPAFSRYYPDLSVGDTLVKKQGQDLPEKA